MYYTTSSLWGRYEYLTSFKDRRRDGARERLFYQVSVKADAVGCVWLTYIWNAAKNSSKISEGQFYKYCFQRLKVAVTCSRVVVRGNAKVFNSESSGVRAVRPPNVVVCSVFISFCIFRSDFNWIIYGSSIQIIRAILERITLNGCIWDIARGASKMLLSWVRKSLSVDTFSKHYGMDWEHIVYKLCYLLFCVLLTEYTIPVSSEMLNKTK